MAKFKPGDFIRHKISGKLFAIASIGSDHTGKYCFVAPHVTHDLFKPAFMQAVHMLDMNKQYTHDHAAQVLYGTKT